MAHWNNFGLGVITFYSKKSATSYIKRELKSSETNKINEIKDTYKKGGVEGVKIISELRHSFKEYDSIIYNVINNSKVESGFFPAIYEALKISVIIIISTLLFIFWSRISSTKYHENINFLAVAYGIPSLFLLLLGFHRYIIEATIIDKYFIGFVLIIITNILAYVTKNHESIA